MFQTGHLTIVKQERTDSGERYQLTYPNFEVRKEVYHEMLSYVGTHTMQAKQNGDGFVPLLRDGDFDESKKRLYSCLRGISKRRYQRTPFEFVCQGLLWIIFKTADIKCAIEKSISFSINILSLFDQNQIFMIAVTPEQSKDNVLAKTMEKNIKVVVSRFIC
ncbi:MAG: hypothetical protein OXC40_01270 [Proteobacteria bacterium]|nr:hypothetical protein [Pseudomonadota bacterium]